jgi:cation:H+ antiporter
MDNLAVALAVFIVSGVVVVVSGIQLARNGDALAEHTGWGHLWVGTIFLAGATSLPELFTNAIAVSIDAPAIAIGTVLGANMLNIFKLGVVGLVLGYLGKGFFQHVARETHVLALVTIAIAVLVLVLAWTELDASLWIFSVGGLTIAAAYLFGMRLVYKAASNGSEDDPPGDPALLRRAWRGFFIAAFAIAVAAPFLAVSADGLAETTGLSGGFIGVLFVSFVTSLPEASAAIEAARQGNYALVMGNLYGSCIFNLGILAVIDPLYREGPILGAFGSGHYAAALTGLSLMVLGWLAMQKPRLRGIPRWTALASIVTLYFVGLFWVFTLD